MTPGLANKLFSLYIQMERTRDPLTFLQGPGNWPLWQRGFDDLDRYHIGRSYTFPCFRKRHCDCCERDELLEPYVHIFSSTISPDFILMDYNIQSHRANLVDDFLVYEYFCMINCHAISLDLFLKSMFVTL